MATPVGNKVSKSVDFTTGVSAQETGSLNKTYTSVASYKTTILSWRDCEFNDPILNVTVLYAETYGYAACDSAVFGDIDARYGSEQWLYTTDGTLLKHSGSGATGSIDGPFADRVVINAIGPFSYYFENKDAPVGNLDYLIATDRIKTRLYTSVDSHVGGLPNGMYKEETRKFSWLYPPYKTLPSENPDNFPSTPSNGSLDVSDGKTKLNCWWTYKITKSGNTNYLNWSPSTSSGSYGLGISTNTIIQGTTYSTTGSSSKSYTHNVTGSSYSGYVKRYYTDYSDIYTTSSTATAKTYSVPELSSITASSSISPRNGDSLVVTLNGMDNKVHSVENTYRTGIWSDFKDKYYIDEATKVSTKTLSSEDIKTLFPDSKATNGVVEGKIYVTRRNVGVEGGSPGSGTTVYETGAKSKNIKVYYKPNDNIDINDEPNDSDPTNSGLAFYKNEKYIQGIKLPKGETWVLPTNYNINDLTGVNVKIQYPKTDTSGVISGYKIQLLLPNDGTHSNDYVWFETYWYTNSYIYTGTISYNDLKRGISGNRIRITPFYIPSNINQGSTESYWYGPTVESKFVDISWKLNKPIIDCPLTETTWHNHKYRILFKLPKDNDTNYKGINDIEVHYGSNNYRYQEIEVKINGAITQMGNNAYINAHNSWNSPTNISGAKLTYERAIILNPSLISTYKDEAVYTISIRVRKAYGQNTNSFDGWSDWSDDIVVNRKTVKNDEVKKHEYILATHYMTVQTAFNSSLACYAKTASNGASFVIKESFNRVTGDNINGPHLSPPQNTPLQTIMEYVSEFKDLHQLKTKINSYGSFDSGRDSVRLDSANLLLAEFEPKQEFITAEKDQKGTDACIKPEDLSEVLEGRNYMKYMCDELNNLK